MSNLLRLGFTATAASNEKSGDTKAKGTQATKQRYEQFKRKRSFVSSWLETFDWLRYDDDIGEMFCRLCEKFAPEKSSSFVTGCSNFRLDSLRSHQKCAGHVSACNKETIITMKEKKKMVVCSYTGEIERQSDPEAVPDVPGSCGWCYGLGC